MTDKQQPFKMPEPAYRPGNYVGEYVFTTDQVRAAYEQGRAEGLRSPVDQGEKDRKDAERYRALKSLAKLEGREGGWYGYYSFPLIPAWDDTAYSHEKGKGFDYRQSLDDAIDSTKGGNHEAS